MAVRKQYLLRIDPDLWAEVEKWAADELRSVNAQVEYVLRDAVRRRGDAAADRRGRRRRRRALRRTGRHSRPGVVTDGDT